MRISRDIQLAMDRGDFILRSNKTGEELVRFDESHPDITINGVSLDPLLLSGLRASCEAT